MSETVKVNPPKPQNYLEGLDGLRGVGCFLVLLIHFHFTAANLPFVLGVNALHSFFIMSAFLITSNLLKQKQKSTSFKTFYKIFYLKRTARIFPVYFLYIFSTIIIFTFGKILFNNSMGVIPEIKKYGWMLFTFVYNLKMQLAVSKGYTDYMSCFLFPHLWSVSLEEQFYFIVIALLWFCNVRTIKAMSIIFIVVIPFVRIYGYYELGKITSDDWLRTLTIIHSPHYQFDSFFYGIAMAVFNLKKARWMIYAFYIALIVFLGHAVINAILISSQEHISFLKVIREDQYFYRNYGVYFLDITLNIFCCAWVYCLIYFPEKFSIFSNKLLVRFGELSYALYVFQFPVLGIGAALTAILMHFLHFPTFIAELTGFITYIILNYYLAVLINRKVETPVALYKEKLLKKFKEKK